MSASRVVVETLMWVKKPASLTASTLCSRSAGSSGVPGVVLRTQLERTTL